jgi:hypothetical protein
MCLPPLWGTRSQGRRCPVASITLIRCADRATSRPRIPLHATPCPSPQHRAAPHAVLCAAGCGRPSPPAAGRKRKQSGRGHFRPPGARQAPRPERHRHRGIVRCSLALRRRRGAARHTKRAGWFSLAGGWRAGRGQPRGLLGATERSGDWSRSCAPTARSHHPPGVA